MTRINFVRILSVLSVAQLLQAAPVPLPSAVPAINTKSSGDVATKVQERQNVTLEDILAFLDKFQPLVKDIFGGSGTKLKARQDLKALYDLLNLPPLAIDVSTIVARGVEDSPLAKPALETRQDMSESSTAPLISVREDGHLSERHASTSTTASVVDRRQQDLSFAELLKILEKLQPVLSPLIAARNE